MRSISVMVGLAGLVTAVQLFACGGLGSAPGDSVTVDPATGVITTVHVRSSGGAPDASTNDESVGSATQSIVYGASGSSSGSPSSGTTTVAQTTQTSPTAPVCHEEGSDRNYVCTKCSTAYTDTITCVPRKVKVYG